MTVSDQSTSKTRLTNPRWFGARFLVALVLTAAVVFAGGWITDMRRTAHGALLTVAGFAFLPFVIIAGGIALGLFLMGMSMFAAILGGGGAVGGLEISEPFIELGARSIGPYYSFLMRRRHPIFWGVPLGVLAGGLALWGFLAIFVIPGEADTVQILIDAQSQLDQRYARGDGYPKPTADGHLLFRDIYPDASEAGILEDGFGRPIRYQLRGRWKLATYALHSYGHDGQPGKDDFCREGGTKFGRFAQAIHIGRSGGKRISISVRLRSIKESLCSEATPK
jgi:hypothetical protein